MSAAQNGQEQLPLLGKMVLQKLDELRQLDARIEQRLGQLEKADASLRGLADNLRNSICEAHPLLGRLNEARQGAVDRLEMAVEQAKQRSACDDPSAEQRQPDLSAIETAVAEGLTRIEARAKAIDADLAVSFNGAKQLIDHTAVDARTETDAAVLRARADLAEAQPILEKLMACKSALDDRSSVIQIQLDEAVAAFTAHADATVAAVRRNVAQQLEQLAAEARLDMRPILSRLTEQQDAAQAQVATAAEHAERALQRRADDLKRNAERMLDLCEQQLVDRLATIRPRTRAAVEAIEQAANQRLAAAMDDMQKTIDRAESQAADRLESLRPRFGEMMLQLERDIREQSKRMEDDAIAGAHWLEHRLAARMEEVSTRINRALRGELDRLDDQATPTPKPRPMSPVQVQVMVEQTRHSQNETASAA